jgi:hypothetical protein
VGGGAFSGGCEAFRAWIFGEELTVRVPAVSVMETLGHDSREPRCVPSRVTRSGGLYASITTDVVLEGTMRFKIRLMAKN